MSRRIGHTLVKITMLLDEHPPEEQAQAMAFLGARYPRCADASDREWERARKADWRARRKEQPELEGVTSPVGHVPGTNGVPPTPEVVASSTSLLFEEASKKLDKADFDFLSQCPEPFRSAWLKDPEWWVSLKDGYPKLPLLQEVSKCMGYVQGKFSPAQQQRLNLRERLRRWLAKADNWRQSREESKAVRR